MKATYVFAAAIVPYALLGLCRAQESTQQKKVVPLTNACFSTHTIGTGGKFMRVCFTRNGNIGRFESPAGQNFLQGNEGYIACAENPDGNSFNAYDAGFAEANWGAATIKQPNGANKLPLTITRKTTNNWIELQQTFDIDPNEFDVTITMTLKNISGKTLYDVYLDRYADWDVPSASNDDYTYTTPGSTFAWNNGANTFAISLSSASTEDPYQQFATYADWTTLLHRYCRSGSLSGNPAGPGDYVGRASRKFGNMAPNTSKTIKFVYRRF